MENKIRGIASSAVEAKLGRCLLVRPARASKGPSKVVWQQLDHRIQVFTNGGGLSSNLRTTKINKREETLRFRSASQSDGPFAGIQRQVDGRLHFFSPLGLFDDPHSDKSIHVSDDRIRWIDSLAHTKKKIPLHPPSGGHVTTLSLSAPS